MSKDFSPICKCGKIWCASEKDAKNQYELENRIRNAKVKWNKVRFYECDQEKGVWHWTRRVEWLDKKDYKEFEKSKCKCPANDKKFLSEREAQAYKKKLPKIEGLSIRVYKCKRGGKSVYHVEYYLTGIDHICFKCNKISYNPNMGSYQTVMKSLNKAGNKQVNSMTCTQRRTHIINTSLTLDLAGSRC